MRLRYKIMLSIIAAIGKNNELGKNNALLWHMSADMKHFRKTTSGHPVIMGQKTYESLGRPLPNRRNIILTRDKNFEASGTEIVYSPEEALEKLDKKEENFVIGGGQIYRLFLPKAERLYITRVEAEFPDADTYFPEIGPEWKEKSREDFPADEENPHPYSFVLYERS